MIPEWDQIILLVDTAQTHYNASLITNTLFTRMRQVVWSDHNSHAVVRNNHWVRVVKNSWSLPRAFVISASVLNRDRSPEALSPAATHTGLLDFAPVINVLEMTTRTFCGRFSTGEL